MFQVARGKLFTYTVVKGVPPYASNGLESRSIPHFSFRIPCNLFNGPARSGSGVMGANKFAVKRRQEGGAAGHISSAGRQCGQ